MSDALIDLTDPRLWIAGTCAVLLIVGGIAGAVWGRLNPPKENER